MKNNHCNDVDDIHNDHALSSSIYCGHVRHRRFSPRENHFTYQLHMLALDVDELGTKLLPIGPFGYAWYHPMRFYEKDYLKGDLSPLKTRITNKVYELGGSAEVESIIMLVQIRCFGFYFSPANFYFCYDKANECRYVLVEVSNTPWNKRHYYLVRSQAKQQQTTDKKFHVSPFMDLAMSYHWKIKPPRKDSNKVLIHIDNVPHSDERTTQKKFFDVSLALKKRKLTRRNMWVLWFSMPIMTFKIVAGIYWQAAKLFAKRIPFISYQNPNELE